MANLLIIVVRCRDLEGSRVHKAMREPYGAVFKEGDTVGMFLHMPSGGRPMERQVQVGCMAVRQ